MSAPPYRSWIEVSRRQIAENYREVKNSVGPDVEIAGVVKADAYRHGAAEISRILVEEGARWLAVSSVEEGVALRDAGIAARILVMADFLPYERPALFEYGLTPVIHSLEDLAELDRAAQVAGKPIACHLKIDSGMNRLGTQAEPGEILERIRRATYVQCEGLMSHFASAADYTSSQSESQIRLFDSVRQALAVAGIHPAYVHMSSTNAIAYDRRPTAQTMVRPGHALYGYVSPARGCAPASLLRVKPALSWKTRVLSIKDVHEGALIGYGGIFRAPQPMRIAILAAGYADGIPHRLSNKGRVIVEGKLVPILGAVSMDLTTIDVTQCPSVRVDDPVILLGEQGEARQDAQQIARLGGTISYNVLCSISARVRRIYV